MRKIKNSIPLFPVIVVLCIFYLVYNYSGESKTYWESVGPKLDRVLNPNKYSKSE